MKQIERIKKVKDSNRASLLGIPGVKGVAVGMKFVGGAATTEMCLQVFVSEKSATPSTPIPSSYTTEDGTVIKTDIIPVGDFNFTGFLGRYRPAKPGAVIGVEGSAKSGTFGALVTDNVDGQKVILGASHVLANFNTAPLGSAILQPSAEYGGTVQNDHFASLKRFVPLNLGPGGVNRVDAAIATPDSQATSWIGSTSFCSPVKVTKQCAVGLLYAAGNVYTIINPIEQVKTEMNVTIPKTIQPSLNMSIHACCAFTGYVQTQITSIMADVIVSYMGNAILWEDQILAPANIASSANGDSGSIFYTTFNC